MGKEHDPVEAFRAQARAAGWPLLCDTTLSFERPELSLFVAVWREKAKDGRVPARSEIAARDVKACMRKIILWERHEGPRDRVRLIGTALVPIWGDMTGRFVDEVVPADLQPRWQAHIGTVLAARRPLRFVTRVDFQNQAFLVAEMASVPLCDDLGRPTMVMCAIHASSDRSWEDIAGSSLALSA
jgi:hypothetical protein